MIFNITGGYKAVIPYMTIMAQINGCDAYYIFEDEKALIKIPKAPLHVNFEEIERNYELLKELENGIEDYPNWRNKNYRRILQTKFHFKEQRESKSEMKNGHLVFDDGNNFL